MILKYVKKKTISKFNEINDLHFFVDNYICSTKKLTNMLSLILEYKMAE